MEILVSGAKDLGFSLTSHQIELFQVYRKELVAWNENVNLTRIVDDRELQIRHFLDSLVVASVGCWDGAATIKGKKLIDVGSGAGFPGLPLKILFPDLELTLLDSVRKKTVFLEHLVAQLELQGVAIITGRAEEVAHQPEYREKFDFVVSRAVASLPVLAEYGLPFARIGGVLISHKKGDVGVEVEHALDAIRILGGSLRSLEKYRLPFIDEEYCLVLVDKVGPTPARYPRRPGMPARHPLSERWNKQPVTLP